MIKYIDFIVQIDKGIMAIDGLLDEDGISPRYKVELDFLEEDLVSLKAYLEDNRFDMEDDRTGETSRQVFNYIGAIVNELPRNYTLLRDITTADKSPLHALELIIDKLCNWLRSIVGLRPVITMPLTVEALRQAGLFNERKDAASSEVSSLAMKH
jgi:hypothetical protein